MECNMNFDALFPVPMAKEVKLGLFVLDNDTALQGSGKAAKLLEADAKRYARVTLSKGEKASKKIVLKQLRGKRNADESYTLEITEAQITITGSGNGIFWGAQTLRQLIRTGGGVLPCGIIGDKPKLRGRGIMLDNTRVWYLH
jgi:N-acetyl-beta-hexosaminidase